MGCEDGDKETGGKKNKRAEEGGDGKVRSGSWEGDNKGEEDEGGEEEERKEKGEKKMK